MRYTNWGVGPMGRGRVGVLREGAVGVGPQRSLTRGRTRSDYTPEFRARPSTSIGLGVGRPTIARRSSGDSTEILGNWSRVPRSVPDGRVLRSSATIESRAGGCVIRPSRDGTAQLG